MKHIFKIMFSLLIVFLLVGCSDAPSSFAVTFDSNGGTAINSFDVDAGELLIEPSPPQKDDYVFDGWFVDQFHTQRYDFSLPVYSTLKLYAKWVVDEIAVLVYIDEDIQALTLPEITFDQTFIDLPKTGSVHGAHISWASHHKHVVLDSGIILSPKKDSASETVLLTATYTLFNVIKSVDYTLVIQPKDDILINHKTDKLFTNLTSEFIVSDGTLTSFYTESGSLPYVDVTSFLGMLDGLIYFDELEFSTSGHLMTIAYLITEEITNDFDEVIDTISTDYIMTIDFEANTVSVNQLSFFDGYIQDTQTEYGDGITYLDPYFESGDAVIFDLNHYRMDLVIFEDEDDQYYLFPFHLANLLFTSGTYYNVYYNGNGYYGIYGIPSSTGTGEARTQYQTIKTSSYNSTEIPSDVLVASYDLFAFTLNNFYGLKEDQNVLDYYQMFGSYSDVMLSGKASDFSSGVFRFINRVIDDLHTSFGFAGYYNDLSYTLEITALAQFGPRVRAWYDVYIEVSNLRASAFGSNIPDYKVIDQHKTLIIYLDSFDTATVENLEGADSDRFMKDTLEDALSKYPSIENIVVDLSFNTGGNLGALLRVLGYMTDEPIEMSFMNPLDGSNVTYFAEVDRVSYSAFNWYIKTSKVTFSAANLMTAIAKHMGIATIIGTTSGGGASSITPMILPDGSFFTMSSLNVLSLRTGNAIDGYTYESIEYGIDPDYILVVKDLYKDNVLINLIAQSN